MSQVVNATAGTLLGFLHEGPMTGWDLDHAIGGSVGEFWNVTRSQVYRELRHLADAELVEVGAPGARARVAHRITEAGRLAFVEWLASEQPEESRRLPILLTTFFGGHLPPDRLAELLARHRASNREAMARYRALEPLLEDLPYPLATVRFGIAYTQMVERWIVEVGEPLARQAPAT